jgi:hypothetical protein
VIQFFLLFYFVFVWEAAGEERGGGGQHRRRDHSRVVVFMTMEVVIVGQSHWEEEIDGCIVYDKFIVLCTIFPLGTSLSCNLAASIYLQS